MLLFEHKGILPFQLVNLHIFTCDLEKSVFRRMLVEKKTTIQ
jgi:hypothetical protein